MREELSLYLAAVMEHIGFTNITLSPDDLARAQHAALAIAPGQAPGTIMLEVVPRQPVSVGDQGSLFSEV